MTDLNIIYDTQNYEVSLINRGAKNIVIIFASAGLGFIDSPVKEFKNSIFSLSRNDFDICWIIDKSIRWYNSENNLSLISFLESLLNPYASRIALGESMGASATLYFSQHLKIDRVVALGPQFSMLQPFINFNTELGPPSINDYLKIKHYGFKDVLDKAFLFFGADSWQDFVHASFFKEFGYHVEYLANSGHALAYNLKSLGILISFLDDITNFELSNLEFKFKYRNTLSKVLMNSPSPKIFDLN